MERANLFTSPPASQSPESFALRVDAYDTQSATPAVIGRRIDTGLPVRVFLRRQPGAANEHSVYTRPEISDFAAERVDQSHPGTAPGGVLLAQSAFRQADGSWGAGWIQSLSHTESEADVFVANCTWLQSRQRSSASGEEREPSLFLRFISDGQFDSVSEQGLARLRVVKPFNVSSVAELRDDLLKLIDARMGAGVRILRGDYVDGRFQPSQFDARYLVPRSDISAQDVVGGFMQSVSGAAAAIESGEMRVEVIPFSTVRIGRVAADGLLSAQEDSRLGAFWRRDSNDVSAPVTPRYVRSIVAVRHVNPGTGEIVTPYVTHAYPIGTRGAGLSLQDAIRFADTPLMQGSRFVEAHPRSAAPAPAARAPAAPAPDTPAGQQESSSASGTQPEAEEHTTAASAAAPAPAAPTTTKKYGYRL